MTDRIPPVSPVERRTGDRRDREGERRAGTPRIGKELVPVGSIEDHIPEAPPAAPHKPAPVEAAGSVFAAQMLGQTGQRRGLKGGPPVMDAARSTYLGAEYSGAKERRPPTGKRGKTEV